jgi:hypothetical protein
MFGKFEPFLPNIGKLEGCGFQPRILKESRGGCRASALLTSSSFLLTSRRRGTRRAAAHSDNSI